MSEFWGFAPCEGSAFFASYNSLDWQRVAPIARNLVTMGYPVWYDLGLQAGTKKWREQISNHIDCACAVVLFVTNGIFDREESYVINEYEEAKGIGKIVIPVFLDTVELKNVKPKYRSYVPEWHRLQCVMCNGENPAASAQIIANAISASDEIGFAANPTKYGRAVHESAIKGGARPSTASENKSGITVGSHVIFGRYPQSAQKPEPIRWQVLEIIDNKALLISDKLLDCKKYNERMIASTWETSSLREWLNTTFLETAFNESERKKLCKARNQNLSNPKYGTDGGNITDDYVFCLSIGQAEKYFSSDKVRAAFPTAFARKNGGYVSSDYGTGWWWLRSPGIGKANAASVFTYGSVSEDGHYINSDDVCIRPVILVQIQNT